MPEEAKKAPEAPTQDDPLKNIKSEFDRKFSNFDKKIGDLTAANQALLQQLTKLSQPPAGKQNQAPQKKMAELIYDDPDQAATLIKEDAKKEMREEIRREQSKAEQRNAAIGQLYQEYPELADMNNPLTKRAVELYNSLSEEEKASPLAYKLSVREAATEIGVAPMNKRQKPESEDYVGGGSGTNSGQGGKRGKKEPEIAPETLDFARHVGLDVDDPKVLEGLKQSSQRNDWLRYRPVRK